PLINDSKANLEAVAQAAGEAGAVYMMGGVLFLKPCAQKAFFPFLEERFPHLVRRYRERYERSAFLRGHYPQMISQRISDIRAKYGLTQKPADYAPEECPEPAQLCLF
ncbi:MAG TPA: hypothetical protein VMZ52_14820, partial [Bryobacteraceae bacterium]|nr:hypothetical protein [Bryobacteraceae bacterium]